jgi:hypothetical protein
MVTRKQARRIDQIRVVHGIENILKGDARTQHSRRVGGYLELRLLPALNDHRRDAV